jgi:adenylate cyclase
MGTRPGHILVVDDDPLNRRLLEKSLEASGHRTTAADNGFAGLSSIDDDAPDLILLDIEMPGLDGIEVLERLKGDAARQHIPVIMISGVEDTESIVRCIEAGAEDFLPKPFDPVILRARVEAGLSRKRLRDLENERVRNVFTRFLPESIAAEMLTRSDGEPSIRAVRLWGTVLFLDLRGFTTFAESRPVEQVIDVLNRYHAIMGDAVLDLDGTLVDYMGDGLFAVFGAPIETVDHADRAVAAAKEMATTRLTEFNDWLRSEGVEEGFRIGVGLNSGRVMSGTLGSERRIEYTVIGDTVNTASRIEQLTKTTGHTVLVADQTRTNMTGSSDELSFVDEFDIRGKQSKVKLWTTDSQGGASP